MNSSEGVQSKHNRRRRRKTSLRRTWNIPGSALVFVQDARVWFSEGFGLCEDRIDPLEHVKKISA